MDGGRSSFHIRKKREKMKRKKKTGGKEKRKVEEGKERREGGFSLLFAAVKGESKGESKKKVLGSHFEK